jgi:hypothetical protein
MVTVIPLSLLAAVLFAEGAVLQQRAAYRDAGVAGDGAGSDRVLGSELVGRLLRDPQWRLGWCVQTFAFLVQAVALHLGSTAVVQPLMVTQLLFTLLLSTVGTGRQLVAWDWAGGIVVCAGLAVLLAVRGAAPATGSPDRPRLVLCTVLVCAAAAVLVIASLGRWECQWVDRWRPRLTGSRMGRWAAGRVDRWLGPCAEGRAERSAVLRATLLATAAGLFTSLSATLTKVTAFDLIHLGIGATARDWPGYLLAATTAAALGLAQASFASGPLPASMTALTITSPIGGYLLGIFAFHATPPDAPGSLAGVAAAGLLLIVGVALLAHSPNVAGVSAVPTEEGGLRTHPDADLDQAWQSSRDGVGAEPIGTHSRHHSSRRDSFRFSRWRGSGQHPGQPDPNGGGGGEEHAAP